jgi:hypothetical protein
MDNAAIKERVKKINEELLDSDFTDTKTSIN